MNYAILSTVKALVTIALLALFALTGEAATSTWRDHSRLPINLPGIIGERTPGGPGIDQSAYEVAADQRVTFNINVTGLGESTASFYLITFADGPEEYDWALEYLHNPADLHSSPAYAIADGKATFQDNFSLGEFNEINNFYFEIFIDANHYMVSRFGEDPNLSITLTKTDYEDGEPYRWYYDLNTTVEFKNGYIAPFHDGPDPLPTPEPTSGLLLLLGVAGLALRRRRAKCFQ